MVQLLTACIALVVFVLGFKRIAVAQSSQAGNAGAADSADAAGGDATAASAEPAEDAPAAPFARNLPFSRGTLVRMLAFVALLAFFAVYAAMGLVAEDFASFAVLSFVLVACALLQLRTSELVERMNAALPRAARWLRPAVVLVACTLLAFLALEVPSNHDIFAMVPSCVGIELALIGLAMLALYFLFQRRAVGPVVVVLAFLVLGIAEYFVVTFKNMPIQPSDMLALETAANVSSGYVYELSAYALYGVAFAAIACAVAPLGSMPAKCAEGAAPVRRAVPVVVNLVVAAIMGWSLYQGVFVVDYIQDLHVNVDAWQPLRSYYSQGFLPSFIVNFQSIQPDAPDGYSDEYADELLAEYVQAYNETEGASARYQAASAQFSSEQPCVVAIMNETFSDLSIFNELDSGYTGPENYRNINDALAKGKLFVSAYGGGTCNTEFEFLTGASLGYMGAGVYPYQLYNLSGAESLARDFTSQGYTATAMHPNAGTNWNRENVYQALGFDEFLTIEDFEGSETYRGMVSDRATYDKILEMLETGENPQFIFNVTMQNHSGYLTGELPAEMQSDYVDYSVTDEESIPETNEYLSLIDESDRALAEFLQQLQELDRPVVVIFFGDHQPYFTGEYNDALMTEDESELLHTQRLWQTEYLVWANYDVAETDQTSTLDDTSTNFLAAQALNLVGAPLTDYQKAQLMIRQEMPAVNLIGYQGADRTWYWHNQGSDYQAAYYALKSMQYRMLFSNGTNLYDVQHAGATNDVDPDAIKPRE